MSRNTALLPLTLLLILLAVIVSAAGLFWPQEGAPFTFTNIHGQDIRM